VRFQACSYERRSVTLAPKADVRLRVRDQVFVEAEGNSNWQSTTAAGEPEKSSAFRTKRSAASRRVLCTKLRQHHRDRTDFS
jgi:hypothetical protein